MPRSRALLAVAAVAAALLVAPLDAAVAAPSATIVPVVTLTARDNGRTVAVHQGDVVEVLLPPTPSGSVTWVWSFPQSSNPAVLALLPVPVPANSGMAFFRAVATGTATLSSVKTCTVTTVPAVCPMLAILWSATVKVDAPVG
jgi:hypothetical protein